MLKKNIFLKGILLIILIVLINSEELMKENNQKHNSGLGKHKSENSMFKFLSR